MDPHEIQRSAFDDFEDWCASKGDDGYGDIERLAAEYAEDCASGRWTPALRTADEHFE